MNGLRNNLSINLYCSYTETYERIKAYSRALIKYDLLSVTDGTKKRSDNTPVLFLLISYNRCKQLVIMLRIVQLLLFHNKVLGE